MPSLTIEQQMEELAIKRQTEYKTYVVDTFPPYKAFNERVICGTFSLTFMDSKVRYISSKYLIEKWGYQTPSEVARDYLTVKFPDWKPRAKGRQARLFATHISQPIYSKPGRWGECAYIDIKSAYWSILKIIGWNVDYMPLEFLGLGTPPTDFPFAHIKMARNSLVSCALDGKMSMWTGKKFMVKKSWNRLLNKGLWVCVQHILHGVANDMIEAGALYVNTDGYIIRDKNLVRGMEVINSWGLPFSIKARGDTEIYGVGDYRVGGTATKTSHHMQDKRQSIVDVPIDWLKFRVKKASKYRT